MQSQDVASPVCSQDPRFPGVGMKVLTVRATGHPRDRIAHAQVAPCGSIPAHLHPFEAETASVITGSGLVSDGEQALVLSTGVAVTTLPGTRHRVANTR